MFFKTGKKRKNKMVMLMCLLLTDISFISLISSRSLIYIAYPLPQDTRFTGTFIRNWHLSSEMVFLHHTNFIDTMGNQSRIHGPVSILCVCTCCIFHLGNILVSSIPLLFFCCSELPMCACVSERPMFSIVWPPLRSLPVHIRSEKLPCSWNTRQRTQNCRLWGLSCVQSR